MYLKFPLSNEDFVIKDEKNHIELMEKYENIVTDDKIIEFIHANEIYAYDFCEYENFNVRVGLEIISCIELNTPILQTSRGIRVGDSILELVKYGDSYSDKYDYDDKLDTLGCYIYTYGYKFIKFFFNKSGDIVRISIEIV